MKLVKKRRVRGALVPFTNRPRKKYPFSTPIPPGSIVRIKSSPSRNWRRNIGRRFRIGYYSWMDGLDCMWLVNDEGKYERTIDHEFLQRHFEIETISNEGSLYGRNRPQIPPVN